MHARLLNVQFAGDYAEAWRRFKSGGPEFYGGQRRSVLGMSELREFAREVTTFSCITDRRFDVVLEPGLRAVGGGFEKKIDWARVIRWIREYDPDVLITSTVDEPLLRPTLCPRARHLGMFYSTLDSGGPLRQLKIKLMAAYLNQSRFEWIGCNNRTTSQYWIDAGVAPTKVIPFSIETEQSPDEYSPKQLNAEGRNWQLLYVGSVIEGKGVGEAIRAAAILKCQGRPARLRIVGRGEVEEFRRQAAALGVAEAVEFADRVPLRELVSTMRAADCVLVPSRHSYTEGSPLVLIDAFCSRTPVVVSDHRVFRASIKDRQWGLMFPAGEAEALAGRISELLTTPALYASISKSSAEAWTSIQVPVRSVTLRHRWVRHSPEDQAWLAEYSYARGQY